MKVRVAVLGTLALIGGCDSLLTRPGFYNRVEVVTTRRNGDPVPGVSLVLYTGARPMAYGVTDSTGRRVFDLVPQGVYGVQTTPPAGYESLDRLTGSTRSTVRDNLFVANDTLSPVRFVFLKPGPGTVSALVTGVDGAPLSGVTATLYSPTKVLSTTTTDAAGRVTFPAVPYGVYGVTIVRPPLYRSFQSPNDSLSKSTDNIIVDEGSNEAVSFRIAKCAGSVRATARDVAGNPLRDAIIAVFTSTAGLGAGPTGADGRFVLPNIPCGTQFGVILGPPPPGYTIASGRGSSFFDGLTVTNGATVDVTFTLQRAP